MLRLLLPPLSLYFWLHPPIFVLTFIVSKLGNVYSPSLIGHIKKTGITGCVFDETGFYLLTASAGGTLALWDINQVICPRPVQSFVSPDLDDIIGFGYVCLFFLFIYLFQFLSTPLLLST